MGDLIHEKLSEEIIGAGEFQPLMGADGHGYGRCSMGGLMIGCLAKTKLDLALLLNFKYANLKWKRVVQSTPLS